MRYRATATLQTLNAVPNMCNIDKDLEVSSINAAKVSMHVNKIFANPRPPRYFSGEAASIKKARAEAIFKLEHYIRFYLSSNFKSIGALLYAITKISILYSVTWRYRKIK